MHDGDRENDDLNHVSDHADFAVAGGDPENAENNDVRSRPYSLETRLPLSEHADGAAVVVIPLTAPAYDCDVQPAETQEPLPEHAGDDTVVANHLAAPTHDGDVAAATDENETGLAQHNASNQHEDGVDDDQDVQPQNPFADHQRAEDGHDMAQNIDEDANHQLQFVVALAVGLSRTLVELATIAVRCKNPQQIEEEIANDADKRNMLTSLRTRQALNSPLTDLAKGLLLLVHIPDTVYYACRARVFRMLTGYSDNWWRGHRLVIGVFRDVALQQQQQQEQQPE
jgi:hypothetical protein